MTDRELKHLNRAELVDIIFEQQKRLEALQQHAEQLEASLQDRSIRLASAGSIAEAALSLNDVFSTAQAAAEQYLSAVQAMASECDQKIEAAEAKAQAILDEANQKAEVCRRQAELEARQTVEAANAEAEKAWIVFQEKSDELICLHNELNALKTRMQ